MYIVRLIYGLYNLSRKLFYLPKHPGENFKTMNWAGLNAGKAN